jgi:hypothetical protein
MVLASLCEIEFIVDVLICFNEGVYEIKGKYMLIAKEWKEGRQYSTLEKRLKVLKSKGVLRKKTIDTVEQAKSIRDTLAHKFIPREYGINETTLNRYGGRNGISHLAATRDCINLSWLNLLYDLNKVQDDIIEGALRKV